MTEKTSKSPVVDISSPPSDATELRLPESTADFQDIAYQAKIIADKCQWKLDWLKAKKPDFEEQYPQIPAEKTKKIQQLLDQTTEKYADGLLDELLDLLDDVHEKTGEDKKIDSNDKKSINKIIDKINKLKKAIDVFDKFIPAEGLKSPLEGSPESVDEHDFKQLEQEIERGREKLQHFADTLSEIMGYGYQEAFDEKFLNRITNFGRDIGKAEARLEALEQAMTRLAEKLKSKSLSADSTSSSFKELQADAKRISKSIAGIEKIIKPDKLTKEIKQEKIEQDTMKQTLNDLATKLENRATEKFFVVKNGKKLALELAKKIKQATEGTMSQKIVDDFIEQAEKNIFAPETESEEKEAKRRLILENLPMVNVEKKILEEMTTEIISVSSKVKSKPKIETLLQEVQRAVSTAFLRNDVLQKMLHPSDITPVEDIKYNIKEYKNEFDSAKEKFNKLLPEIITSAKKDLAINLDFALAGINQKYLSNDTKAMLEGAKTILLKDADMNLEEIDELNMNIKTAIEAIQENRKAEMDQEMAEREFFKKGDEESGAIEEELSRPLKRPVQFKKPAPMPDIREVEKSLPPVSRKEVQSSIAEMLAREGVVEINPDVLLSFFSETEINNLIDSVKKDALANSNKNREDFNVIFKEILGDRILDKLEKSKREQMTEVITEQVYSLLRGAVEAESQKEIAVLQAGKASKLGKVGSFAARMAPQLAMAAGIGIGAGLVIGSGGAAAAVAGASIGLVRLLNKKIAKSEIFQTAKEKAGSFWGKTVGRLFKKEKPPVENEKVIAETADKYINKEILASILSNQLRENSSQDLIEQVQVFAEDKNKAMRNPSPELFEKFSNSLDEISQEFYKNSYNYLLARFPEESEEKIAIMAEHMAKSIRLCQRNEISNAQAIEYSDKKAKDETDKGWLVDKMEKFFKFRSEGAGAVLFGGALGYAIAETSSAGRVASGVLAGAGLGLIIEKKTRMAEDEKLQKTIEKMIEESENKLFGKEIFIAEKDFEKAKNDSASIQSKLDLGVLDNNKLLKIRAENFVIRVDSLMLKKYELQHQNFDEYVIEKNKHTKKLEKETQKTAKKLLKSFDTKNRALVYMGVGAVVGGLAGYAGARLADYLRAPEGETIVSAEKGFIGGAVYPAEQLTPPETPLTPIPPETPLTPIPPETPLKPIEMESDVGSEHVYDTEPTLARKSVLEQLRRAETTRPAVESVPVVSDSGDVLNVHQVYSADIADLRLRGMDAGEPIYLTKDEVDQINQLISEEKTVEALNLINNNYQRGPVFEDLSTGQQYHADELDFKAEELPSVEKPKPSLYSEEEVYGKRPKLDIKNPYDEDMPEPRVRPEAPRPRLNIENPYDNMEMTVDQIKTTGGYQKVLNVLGNNTAERYVGYAISGNTEGIQKIEDLVDTIEEVSDGQLIHMETEPVATAETEPTPESAPEAEPVTETTGGELTDEQMQAERARIVREAEERLKAEDEIAEEEEFDEEEISKNQVREITNAREQNLVNELKGANAVKAREAYGWLMENQDNPKAVELKNDFVKDMLDDNKIKPSLLRQINNLRGSI